MTTTTEKPLTAKEVAEIITARLMPEKAKPLTERGVARLCKLGRLTDAYMVFGDWCIPRKSVDEFIEGALKNTTGRTYERKVEKK